MTLTLDRGRATGPSRLHCADDNTIALTVVRSPSPQIPICAAASPWASPWEVEGCSAQPVRDFDSGA